MAFYLSPLVDVKEVDLITTIPAVATSIAAIVLRNTYKGPEMTQEYITSPDQLIDRFGYSRMKIYTDNDEKRVSSCYEDINSALGFLKDGAALYCTRVMPDSATFSGTKVSPSGDYVKFSDETVPALTLNTETVEGDISEPDEFDKEARSMIIDNGDDIGMIAANRGFGGNNIRVWLIDKDSQENPPTGTMLEALVAGIDDILDTDQDFLLVVESKQQGSKNWEIVETHNVSLDETSTDDQGVNNFAETYINNNSRYVRIVISDTVKNDTVPAVGVTEEPSQFGGGIDYDGMDDVEDASIIEAYELYKRPEELDVNILIDSNKSLTVKQTLIEICNSRKDAMAILDPPRESVINNKGSEVTDLVDGRKTTLNANTSYAATYGNWFNVYDKYLKDYVWIPVSGYMAGIFARTDDMSDPWFAPAGLNRAIITGVRKLAGNPSDIGERDKLYKNGINPIVSFSGQGKVVFGQKNLLDKSSAFNRINVRRLFMVLQKASSTASKYFLFEPNDRFTQKQIKSMIDPFLQDVQSRRGITGFYVLCDETNNTPVRVDRNELWVDIFIKPNRSSEYIILRFINTPTGANFEELIGEV